MRPVADYYLLNAAIKGVVEGLTEFLPVSSTGHLVLFDRYCPLADAQNADRLNKVFNIVVQFPAVLAIVILFRARLWKTLAGLRRTEDAKDRVGRASLPADARRFWLSLFLAFLPAAALGLLFLKKIEHHLMSPVPIAIASIAGGIVLIAVERLAAGGRIHKAEDVPPLTAFQIGLFQCLGLIPGTSRSGATIVGGRLRGLDRRAAAEFSFFLALPVLGCAFAYKLFKEHSSIHWQSDGPVLLVGCAVSFVTAWLVVALFIRFLEKHSLALFGWYRILLGLAVLLFAGE